uniref:Uncharacterized protein n=1 Tax=Euplotes crassus TaxID=5936 RepID=A0A7S3P0L1_EUPCR|mmetsp:Transcript_37136/g.36722  ORF Transcript_37136/g.36722 Transcript_37136/m.36722 type:complete len:399 (+) Transcript_37136:12-1208(+)|eukprot:CAMPEP_0196995336 /NCGR_PEP_ID=MMETSP1380-20130617/1478_1 /TAXON_ID=5936 /ORGANISM="Euplotes crassus, Strain CT5" /LENGTH=398 /DNA_ID=CAMNT_0042410987 /DNA_START=9 /DNA_END=1205 /DNA_ORIENTATION=+
MFTSLGARQLSRSLTKSTSVRYMSGAAMIRDKFQQAYVESRTHQEVVLPKEPENKAEYGAGYYQRYQKGLKKGYTHPYHSKENPIHASSMLHQLNLLSDLVGPEQVSPHYESLSRSRRGLIFLFAYFGTITTLSRLGGWDHNDWIRGLIFHHEYLIALYVGYAELRHFTWLPGPKFTIFYDVFSKYETMQLANQWNDTAEELSTQFYQNTKRQIDYFSIHNEYKFVKKRSMVNFMTNERLNLEKHFHERTVNMLHQIQGFEQQNMKNKLKSVTQEAFDATLAKIESDEEDVIYNQCFDAALDGIRKGRMDFKMDPVLPIMTEELSSRVSVLKNLTEEQENRLLSINEDQKKAVAQTDGAARDTYLRAVPQISSQGLKNHAKFLKFVHYLTGINRKDIK